MCHGLIDQRATISLPDLLRSQCYQITDYNDNQKEVEGGSYPSVDVLSVLDDSLSSEDALAGINIIEDYSSAVKKFDDGEDNVDIFVEADALASTGSLSTWFDCIKDDFCSEPAAPQALVDPADKPDHAESVSTKTSRKARKSAVKEPSHAQHDSEMDDEAPVLIDEKRKRRMSSNRASAQRSRQRKQERLDELEILTAQLRLENATLSRRSKMAEHLAMKIELEKNELAKKLEELKKELEAARHPHFDSGDDSNDSNTNLDSGVCDMVETSPQSFSKGGNNVAMEAKKRTISSTDLLSHGIFQELYDAIESDQFEVSFGAEVTDLLQEQWFGSFTECLNAA
jgi:hypothetical protein